MKYNYQVSKTRNLFKKFKDEVLGISSVIPSKIKEHQSTVTFQVKANDVLEVNKSKKNYQVILKSEEKKVIVLC